MKLQEPNSGMTMMAASVFLFVLVTTPLFVIVCRLVTCITMYLVRSQYSLVQAY